MDCERARDASTRGIRRDLVQASVLLPIACVESSASLMMAPTVCIRFVTSISHLCAEDYGPVVSVELTVV